MCSDCHSFLQHVSDCPNVQHILYSGLAEDIEPYFQTSGCAWREGSLYLALSLYVCLLHQTTVTMYCTNTSSCRRLELFRYFDDCDIIRPSSGADVAIFVHKYANAEIVKE